MEQYLITENLANTFSQHSTAEIVGLEVTHSYGRLNANIYIREGTESLLSVYTITGQLKFRKRILNSGLQHFPAALKKGVYVATLVSGKSWAARKLTVD
ncbi:MAG: T9SS type A sorting domain-containing protein [Bacteroidales bacterium]